MKSEKCNWKCNKYIIISIAICLHVVMVLQQFGKIVAYRMEMLLAWVVAFTVISCYFVACNRSFCLPTANRRWSATSSRSRSASSYIQTGVCIYIHIYIYICPYCRECCCLPFLLLKNGSFIMLEWVRLENYIIYRQCKNYIIVNRVVFICIFSLRCFFLKELGVVVY